MHKLLERQLRRAFGDDPPTDDRSRRFVHLVDGAYQAADAERSLLERSIELTSKELLERNAQLERDLAAIQRLEIELNQAEKLRAVGQLASGIAHEINTPIQFVSDSMHFLRASVLDMLRLVEAAAALATAVAHGDEVEGPLATYREIEEGLDLDFLQEECPRAFEQTQEGLNRVAEIVMAMKEFGRPDQREKVLMDVSRCVSSTLTVAHNELKYAAHVKVEIAELPAVPCYPGELGQVILNLLVNAAHAITTHHGPHNRMGHIEVRTFEEPSCVVIEVQDDGGGIAEEHKARIFEPFFTTKAVGRGTGQGLAISRSIVVDKHHGSLTFTTEPGVGTTFTIRLPKTDLAMMPTRNSLITATSRSRSPS